MSNHAVYSPSASSRWLNCPGSVKATAELNATTSEHTVYSAMGTAIHALGEIIVRMELCDGEDAEPVLYQAEGMTWGYYADVGKFNDELVTAEMVQQAMDYLSHAKALYRPGDQVLVEKKLAYSDVLFGTADLVLYNHERIAIVDLKTGAGNLVSPEENLQLLTYAAMFIARHAKVIPPEVHLCIIQPPDESQCKVWVTDERRVIDHLTEIHEAIKSDELCAGDHCRWCPVRASCTELHAMATNAMSQNLDGLSPTEWADALHMAEVLKPWCQSVFDRANQLVSEEGLSIPGYKLVEKKGRRNWKNETAAEYAIVDMLDKAEVALEDTPIDIWNPRKLRTPLQVMKACKGIVDKEEIEVLTEVKSSGNILVKEEDKREAVETGVNLLDAAEQLALFT